ncbi:Putative Oxidoreductase family, NAD-binding Rossmann fold protein [Penicillium brasilianum]|uniref:Putative Oxidoreductase family, NAD-binding Rossmann fold protein n=1 Tax=Penicillium brasilianum TaxID=104259 RepID=A0A0F7TQX6_PENBI|nr:Putative Oxidoreductase family, NAD-binding Rossmann fold protein [Penicillium brasilianum]
MPIGVAIIGSGNFAKEQHLPAVKATADLQLKAIYSRSLKSAQTLASGTPDVDLYSDDSGTGKSYDDLLARSDIGAVIIGLPILAQPEFIKRALTAGKHVLSEKPIAKDVATARELLQWYQKSIDPNKTIWAVGENFRYMTKFLFAAEKVRELGRVRQFRVNVQSRVKEDNKYYLTSWRKTPEYQGGFLLDGGVHMLAGLRLILGSTEHLAVVSAQTQQLQDYLPPVDTVDAVVQTKSGATGVVSLSWGSDFNDNSFEFACEKGVVTLQFDNVTVNGVRHHIEFDGKGVVPEVAEFASTVLNGRSVAERQSPEQALADLEALEQMLESGKTNGERMMLHFQV